MGPETRPARTPRLLRADLRTDGSGVILEEPTTGFENIHKLLGVCSRLVDRGNTVMVIEHNLDVITTADWIVDLGPEVNEGGGQVMVEGAPELVAKVPESYTGQFLAKLLDGL